MPAISIPLSPGDASAMVQKFLSLMQARDLGAAGQMLAPGFTMHFPGGASMQQLDQLLHWASSRYRSVAKNFERFDESRTGEGEVVYCLGTLHGVWLDGSAFSGIRFIDRFEIAQGLIQRQDVWNDLALAQPESR